jgi:hypothetical protein
MSYYDKTEYINNRDTKVHYLISKLTMLRAKQPTEPDDQNRIHKLSLAITMELHRRMRVDHVFEEFLAKGTSPLPDDYLLNPPTNNDSDAETFNQIGFQKSVAPKNFFCLKRMMELYEKFCGDKLTDNYDLAYTSIFVQECEKLPVPSAIDALIHRLQKACGH